jgi:methionyl-tRNA formyltransferase
MNVIKVYFYAWQTATSSTTGFPQYLPRWRGAAPIHRAIMAGDKITGVQVMRMEEGLDTGPVLATAQTSIEADDTTGTLHDRLAALGATLLIGALAQLERGDVREVPQAEAGVTYAHKITPAETRIDWMRPAREVDCMIRGLSPHPGAWFELGGARIKALHSLVGLGEGEPGEALDDSLLIACGSGAVRLLTVQREGRGPLDAEVYLRGAAVPAGTRLAD